MNFSWKYFIGGLLFSFSTTIFAVSIDPCNGLLAYVDRPSIGDSVCAIPSGDKILEMGYQYGTLFPEKGIQQNFPEPEFRIGLPFHNELFISLPNYIHQTITPHSGLTETDVGFKHTFPYTENSVSALEGIIDLPTGSNAFGSASVGGTINGIFSYNLTPIWNFVFMLGVSNEAVSNAAGGQRFSSVNPDVILTLAVSDHMNLYGEVYGQSKSAPGESSGWNTDAGLVYLLLKNMTVDVELGQRIHGTLGSYNHYVGAGFALQF